MSSLLTQLQEYGRQLDEEARPISFVPPVAPTRERKPMLERPWAVAALAATVTLVLIGAAAWMLRDAAVEPANPMPKIPETWETWTSSDGIVSECACDMAMARDSSIWLVGFDGISRFDGTVWERIEPPRPFDGEGWPAIAHAPDGSTWVLGMSYIAQYTDGVWGPIIDAGHQDDGGPLFFQGLQVDDAGLVWTNLEDIDGVILDGVFTPRAVSGDPGEEGYTPPQGLGVLATAPNGSVWMTMGDSIIGVEGALVEDDGEQLIRYALGGVEDAIFEPDGTGWFLVPEVGPDAWLYGREQWSDPGLYRLENGTWYRITTADGLAGYDLSELVVEEGGTFWMSTASGTVTRYQPGTDPRSGVTVEIDSRPFTDADIPPPAYPPTTTSINES